MHFVYGERVNSARNCTLHLLPSQVVDFNVQSMTQEIGKFNQSTTEATTSYKNAKLGNRAVTPFCQTIVTNTIKLNDEKTAFLDEFTTESPVEVLKTLLGKRSAADALEEEDRGVESLISA